MNQLKTILVGVDFSECSRSALEQAVRLARWNNAGLRIIHALAPPSLNSVGEDLQPMLDELRGRMREHAIARLADWAAVANAPAGHSREVINGVPLDVLLTESRSKDDCREVGRPRHLWFEGSAELEIRPAGLNGRALAERASLLGPRGATSSR